MRLFNSAREYHEKTKYAYDDIKFFYKEFASDPQPVTNKEYSDKPVVDLPKRFEPLTENYFTALQRSRGFAGFRMLENETISLENLSHLLYLTNGVTLVREFPTQKIFLRAAPSASGLYPTEVYLLVNNVSDLPKGLYYFHPRLHQLIRILDGDQHAAAEKAGFQQKVLRDAPVLLFLTSVFSRNSWKFKNRAYRYCLMDAGYVGENIAVAAAGLGLAANLVGDFVDEEVNNFLGIDGSNEAAIMVASIGKDAGALTEDSYTFGMIKPDDDIINELYKSLIQGIHKNSAHFMPGEDTLNIDVKFPHTFSFSPKEAREDFVDLPAPIPAVVKTVHQVIETRRSSYNFLRISLSDEELSTLLWELRNVPSLYDYPSYFTYLVVNNVKGLENGIYLYHPEHHKLEFLRRGTYRGDISFLTLAQDAVFNSSVALFFTTDFEKINIFANRGYRYAHFNVGMLSENIYLTATALGLAVRGIGNFFDDSLNTFLRVREPHENVLGGVIVGRS
ncbi:MAG TPA: SagB/ThcOx family dehydrogenase [Caldithrix sp.]|nr:SagB/ThcOx family dehydrogenase [Caldithrix sp.]